MATRYETLIDTVVAKIGADVAVDSTKVFANRVADLNDTEMPAYNVVLGPDAPLSELGATNVAYIDWQLILFVDCYVRSILADVDAVFLDMRRNVHRALMADHTQGLAFVMTTIPGGADEPNLDDEGDRKSIVYRLNWGFQIRTSINSLET